MDRIMYNVIHPIGRKVLLQVFLKVILKFSMPTIGVTNKQTGMEAIERLRFLEGGRRENVTLQSLPFPPLYLGL